MTMEQDLEAILEHYGVKKIKRDNKKESKIVAHTSISLGEQAIDKIDKEIRISSFNKNI